MLMSKRLGLYQVYQRGRLACEAHLPELSRLVASILALEAMVLRDVAKGMAGVCGRWC